MPNVSVLNKAYLGSVMILGHKELQKNSCQFLRAVLHRLSILTYLLLYFLAFISVQLRGITLYKFFFQKSVTNSKVYYSKERRFRCIHSVHGKCFQINDKTKSIGPVKVFFVVKSNRLK